VEFTERAGCYLVESNDGGSFPDMYTAETCAQLCLNDPCCKSFDSGFGANEYDCALSYETASTAPSSFVCDASKNYNYFEKQGTVPVNDCLVAA
jgi:hypothetical protein